eukprot:Nk52_evm96s208 gene=Nk52_evmTU96s208
MSEGGGKKKEQESPRGLIRLTKNVAVHDLCKRGPRVAHSEGGGEGGGVGGRGNQKESRPGGGGSRPVVSYFPRIKLDPKYRVPSNVRQKFLQSMCEEYARLMRSDGKDMSKICTSWFDEAKGDEEAIYMKCSGKIGYQMAVKKELMRLKRLTTLVKESEGKDKGKSASVDVGKFFVECQRYLLDRDALVLNGFPLYEQFDRQMEREGKEGEESPRGKREEEAEASGAMQCYTCARCGVDFWFADTIKEDDKGSTSSTAKHGSVPVQWNKPPGGVITGGDGGKGVRASGGCTYHEGKVYNIQDSKRYSSGREFSFNCCGGSPSSPGCKVCDFHVPDMKRKKRKKEGGEEEGEEEDLCGYDKTREATVDEQDKKYERVYALDCEMCFTTKGLELARLSVVDEENVLVYDRLIQPKGYILDYLTEYSGLTKEGLDGVTRTLEDVREEMKGFVSAATILVGHSLDSDFKALKVVHEKVIDTSVLFPHKLGHPYKRRLKNIVQENLHRFIQTGVKEKESTEGTRGSGGPSVVGAGHDSTEDATACMDLLKWKLGRDRATKRPGPVAISSHKRRKQEC